MQNLNIFHPVNSSGVPLIESTAAFTSVAFTTDHETTFAAVGLSADTLKIQFSVPDADGADQWEDSGTVLDVDNKMQTSYGPGRYRVVRVGTADTLSLCLWRNRRK